jgi:hypothetical protein
MRRDTFEAAEMVEQSAQCLKCGSWRKWSKSDVDPASFVRANTIGPARVAN